MADYTITFARSASKELQDLPDDLTKRILPRIKALAAEPRPSGCRKLANTKDRWRIRVGDYRVIYSISDQNLIIDVIRIRHRSKAYD